MMMWTVEGATLAEAMGHLKMTFNSPHIFTEFVFHQGGHYLEGILLTFTTFIFVGHPTGGHFKGVVLQREAT